MKNNKFKQAILTDVNLNDLVEEHIKRVTTPKYKYEWVVGDENEWGLKNVYPISTVDKEGKKPPRKEILIHKYKFLIHNIIMRCRASKDNSVQLNYARYVKVLGKAFGDMLYNLRDKDIISLSNNYTMGQSSRRIALNDWNIDFVEGKNIKVIEYQERLNKTYEEEIKRYTINNDNAEFVANYNRCLSQLKLTRRNEALEYIEGRRNTLTTPHSYQYYKSRIEDFNKKELKITNIDTNGRIYHYLTNMPKSLKKFFNINWQLDIANCHPLLFSYFLINKYQINKDILKSLNTINYTGIEEYHNKGKQLSKILKNNNIEVSSAKSLPNDVLLYIYLTMKGRFWDYFVDIFKTLDRGEVKATLFREVFYSHSTTTRHKEYAKKFAEIYPNVWHNIRMMKKESKGNLPNQMMAFESKVFGGILRRCFEKGWCVVSIHDAIIVLDVPRIEHFDTDELNRVMVEEFEKYGLYPTISVDAY